MMEEWRAVPGYEGLYEVSNTGMVRSLRHNKIMSPNTNRYGYKYINLCKDGIIKTKTIHRLVAQVFIPNPDNLPEVNHKDEDKTNNSVDNLEWCVHIYNMNYRTRNIRAKETAIKNGSWSGLSREEYQKKWRENNKDYHKKWLEKHPGYMDKYKKNKI